MRRQVVIHLLLSFSIKSTEFQGWVGGGKKPQGTGSEAIPGPGRDQKDVFDTPIPGFPMREPVWNVFNVHGCIM